MCAGVSEVWVRLPAGQAWHFWKWNWGSRQDYWCPQCWEIKADAHPSGSFQAPNLFCSRAKTANIQPMSFGSIFSVKKQNKTIKWSPQPWFQHHQVCLGLNEETEGFELTYICSILWFGLKDVQSSWVPFKYLEELTMHVVSWQINKEKMQTFLKTLFFTTFLHTSPRQKLDERLILICTDWWIALFLMVKI